MENRFNGQTHLNRKHKWDLEQSAGSRDGSWLTGRRGNCFRRCEANDGATPSQPRKSACITQLPVLHHLIAESPGRDPQRGSGFGLVAIE